MPPAPSVFSSGGKRVMLSVAGMILVLLFIGFSSVAAIAYGGLQVGSQGFRAGVSDF